MDKIQIISWFSPSLLDNTNYKHGDLIDGNEDKALEIAGELFKSGLNVIIKRLGINGYCIAVSNVNFCQR